LIATKTAGVFAKSGCKGSSLNLLCAAVGAAVMPTGFNADHGKGGRGKQKADEVVDDV
jgi:hypothetical protein